MTDRPRLAIPDAGMLATTRTRRDVLKLMAAGGALLLLPPALAACGGDDDDGITGPPPNSGTPLVIDFARGDVAVLQLAYALEQLEADFYTRAVSAFSRSNLTAAEKLVLDDIRQHEVVHRELLRATLGTTNGFTITPTFGTRSFTDRVSVLNTAKALEDLGVAAYDGSAQYLRTATNLLLAARIVSVEARHAAVIRDLLNARSADFAPQAFDTLTRPAAVGTAAQAFVVNALDLQGAPSTFVPGPATNV